MHPQTFLSGFETYTRTRNGFRLQVHLDGPVDPHTGFVTDFFDIEKCFAGVVDALDHRCLNDVEGLENPTAENIAVWIWERLKPGLEQISAVRVYETADCWAKYHGR
ncbi:6-carboxytetrahydropterin synthase [Bradyrhizobium sp. AUGA SZCCT0283]|uniref:6-pyruvoyl trahydropterin synthase family protein n=1 Tax=Bradyrhizobium sp. AUGA SZCCT0283 TaxID=2807671 RepID=UPI001BA76575|nr:6-carboxytetrahydropterin synthase [Bradyrhizobium sp. AUGA SZCCT0283]MBR1279000.1 6-carboxytetrahydropterin synthase [Bradyrhizobium sp. AUGA SZCCT0283]